ncbi:unnamed protein product [Phyllotreta striolata]|uniref:Retinoid-inducible serine carboxypeptidase n=1 Tax=Phyllotreta striolata TaxID=444603 RepID=A0A9N9XMR7_PHYSR|nr:unnamed protein product [Phyllotreta striolata]
MWCKFFVVLVIFQVAYAKHGFGPTDQDWGHVAVRSEAYIFWWLHYTTANVTKYTDRPLIIWLQGGPGGSSTGYGNFVELGPLDLDLQPRNTSWVQWANILFVDNPVGTGFSYVENNEKLTRNNTEIANDFLVFWREFLEKIPDFKKVPTYIFCESYGGKMTAEIALVIDQARKSGKIETNLKGVALGDSWISPVDSILGYAPYLFSLGQIDKRGYNNIMKVANQIKADLDRGDAPSASELWDTVDEKIFENTYGVDMYNILTKIQGESKGNRKVRIGLSLKDDDDDTLDNIMNNKVGPALGLSQHWTSENSDVFNALFADFMNPVTTIVERLLNETDITVAVYNGQLDLIVETPGTYKWVEDLHFKDKSLWEAASRSGFAVNGYYEGYRKKHGKFSFYWVDRAGHMVPKDNPSAMYYILNDVTNNFEV